MREIRHYNTQLLKNILPDHVANYFLSQERPPTVSEVRTENKVKGEYSEFLLLLTHCHLVLSN